MKVLAIEREQPGSAAADFLPLLDEEAAAVWELHQRGVVRELHFRSDRREAVLVLECADEAEAERALAGLPLARAGLIRFEIIGLRPYDGFARLFTRREGGSSGATG